MFDNKFEIAIKKIAEILQKSIDMDFLDRQISIEIFEKNAKNLFEEYILNIAEAHKYLQDLYTSDKDEYIKLHGIFTQTLKKIRTHLGECANNMANLKDLCDIDIGSKTLGEGTINQRYDILSNAINKMQDYLDSCEKTSAEEYLKSYKINFLENFKKAHSAYSQESQDFFDKSVQKNLKYEQPKFRFPNTLKEKKATFAAETRRPALIRSMSADFGKNTQSNHYPSPRKWSLPTTKDEKQQAENRFPIFTILQHAIDFLKKISSTIANTFNFRSSNSEKETTKENISSEAGESIKYILNPPSDILNDKGIQTLLLNSPNIVKSSSMPQ